MFNGMYDLMNKLKKKPISEKIALQKNATPILSAEDLLSGEKRQQTLTDIRTLLNLPDEEYNKIFLTVVHQFALFVQNLPETERSFYASLGGMIDHALDRASLSLFLARTYLLPEGSTLSTVSEEEMLWVYAIFTASLFLDIGKIPTRHVVSMTDSAGNTIEAWHPYAGPMQIKDNKTHYIFGFMDDPNDDLRWQVTPLLARQLMPVDGFNWLSSNEEVLQAWIGLLTDDQTEMGWLKVIPLADAQILESYFTDRKVFRHSLSSQTIALIHKIQKEKKDSKQRQKELGEKMLGENAEKAIRAIDEKGHVDESKLTKQALFGYMAASEQSKLKSFAQEIRMDSKDIVKQFLNWTQAQEKSSSSDVKNNAVHVKEGVLIANGLLDKFVSDNKQVGVTAEQLYKVLADSGIANPVTHIQLTGQVSPPLLVSNPYLVFPSGPPPIVIPAQTTPAQAPAVQQQGLREAGAIKEQQAQEQARHTPTPYTTTPKR